MPNLETNLATAELMNMFLLALASNLAVQLALADGGDMTTVKAAISRAMDDAETTIPAEPLGIDPSRIDNAVLDSLCLERQNAIMVKIVERVIIATDKIGARGQTRQ